MWQYAKDIRNIFSKFSRTINSFKTLVGHKENRKRRGVINGSGSIFKLLFGTYKFWNHFHKTVTNLDNNEKTFNENMNTLKQFTVRRINLDLQLKQIIDEHLSLPMMLVNE